MGQEKYRRKGPNKRFGPALHTGVQTHVVHSDAHDDCADERFFGMRFHSSNWWCLFGIAFLFTKDLHTF